MLRERCRRTTLLAGLLALGSYMALPSVAGAQAAVAISGGPYEIEKADDTQSLSLDVINATGAEIEVRLESVAVDDDCSITAEPERVERSRTATVKFILPMTCAIEDDGISLTFRATQAETTVLDVPLTATVPKDESGDFAALRAYVVALVAAAILTTLLYQDWKRSYVGGDRPNPSSPLPGIKADWSFKDSWGSNVGLAATIFTGVLGASDVLEKILGDGKESAVSLAVVAAALSAGFIGAAPLVLASLRTAPDTPEPPQGASRRDSPASSVPRAPKERTVHSVGGVLAGSTIVMAANLGQIWVMATVVGGSDVVSLQAAWALAAVATAVLTVYAVRTIPQTLISGLNLPPEGDSEVMKAAKLVGESILTSAWLQPTDSEASIDVRSLDNYPAFGTSSGDELRRAPAAMF